jgi:hypothetical protein
MRKSLNTFVLLLVLCCPAFAGDMLTPPVTTPPPSSTTSVAPKPEDEITNPATVDEPTTQDISVTRIALSIFESILTVI